MTYSLTFVASYGSGQTGLTLNAKLYDTAGAQTGATISSGIVEIGNGVYMYTATIPDDHRGAFTMYKSTDASIIVAFAVNPEEAEYSNLRATLPDSVPADGTIPSAAQALYMAIQSLNERSVSGTTVTVKKVDGSTTLYTLTLNDGSNPASITRAT